MIYRKEADSCVNQLSAFNVYVIIQFLRSYRIPRHPHQEACRILQSISVYILALDCEYVQFAFHLYELCELGFQQLKN